MASESEIILQERVLALEQTIYGNSSNKITTLENNLSERLKSVDAKITNVLFKKPRISTALKQSDDLIKYLNLSLHPEIEASDTNVELILAFESKFKEIVKMLEKVEELKKNLESQHIQESKAYLAKLAPIANDVYKSKETEEKFEKELYDVVTHYNAVVELVSQQLIVFDRLLTIAEAEKIEKQENQ